MAFSRDGVGPQRHVVQRDRGLGVDIVRQRRGGGREELPSCPRAL